MKQIGILLLSIFCLNLTGCSKVIFKAQEIVEELKYQYYYKYQGEVSCVVDQIIRNGETVTVPEGLVINIKELQSEKPEVEYLQKKLNWRKVIESQPMVNIQYLDIVTGSSTVLILEKNTGKMQVVENLYDGQGELSFVVQKAHCK